VGEEFLESAFLVLSGLGFIPGLMGTITDTMGTVTDLIMGQMEPIMAALTSAKDFLIGFIGGAVGAAGGSGMMGGMAATLIGGGAGILQENLDTAKIDEAIQAANEEEEGGEAWLERVRKVFDAIDADGDGTLDRQEVKAALKSKEMRHKFFHNDVLMSPMMFRRLFQNMDKNHDGLIDFEEVNALTCTFVVSMNIFQGLACYEPKRDTAHQDVAHGFL
jgi:hypothetical protein